MEWQEPHPQRLPTSAEIANNLIKIQEAKKRMQQLTLQIQDLERARNAVQRDHDNRVSFIAPFRRLPEDILREIATHSRKGKEGPKLWELNQINKATRIAVNGMRSLWSTIWIKPRNADVRQWTNAVPCAIIDHLRLIFERAATAPLTIILEEGFESQMFQELLPYEGNISRLILSNATGSRQLSRNYFEGLPDLKLTNLQALVVLEDSAYNYSIFRLLNMASHSKCTDMALRFTWYDFRSISTLTELQIMQRVTTLKIKLHNQPAQIPQSGHSIPRLETLDLSGALEPLSWDMPKLRALRVHQPQLLVNRGHIPSILEDFCLDNADLILSGRAEPSDIRQFARLTCLTIRDVRLDTLPRQYFEMPCLEEFTLSSISPYSFESQTHSFIGRGRPFGHLPSLKRLWADNVSIPLMDDFSSCPNLIALRITHCSAHYALLSHLGNDPTSVPRLEEFLFEGRWRYTTPLEVYMQKWANERPGLRVITDSIHCQHSFRVGKSTWREHDILLPGALLDMQPDPQWLQPESPFAPALAMHGWPSLDALNAHD